ncbi:hypothetical protein EYF80_062080 [Liparis tanakae]|uniref:Uncharacterized protein n=1 Tax=Liparis tanakae TaxID=230148 RepID=A0A4Z2EG70_9TELE|nr:hypothetical protein EYF80_062080 [Liparis tanakae]
MGEEGEGGESTLPWKPANEEASCSWREKKRSKWRPLRLEAVLTLHAGPLDDQQPAVAALGADEQASPTRPLAGAARRAPTKASAAPTPTATASRDEEAAEMILTFQLEVGTQARAQARAHSCSPSLSTAELL